MQRLPFSIRILLEAACARLMGLRSPKRRSKPSQTGRQTPPVKSRFPSSLLRDPADISPAVPSVVDLAALTQCHGAHGRRSDASTRSCQSTWSVDHWSRSIVPAACSPFTTNAERV